MAIANAAVRISIKTKKSPGLVAGNNIPSIVKRVRSNSAQNSYNFARGTEASAKRRVHVITGHLRDSIKRVKTGYGKHEVVVGAYYGVYEEYGTRYRPPHPYFRPAIEENKARFMADMKSVFHH